MFFFLLFSFRNRVGEKPVSLLQVDYLSQDQELDRSLQEQEHGSPVDPVYFLSYLCQQKPSYCQKITYSGDLSDLDKFEYTTQYFTILSFLDQNKKFGIPCRVSTKNLYHKFAKG